MTTKPRTVLRHRLETGEIATRTTKNDYTHVVVARLPKSSLRTADEIEADYAYLEDPTRIAKATEDALRRQAEQRAGFVWRWSGGERQANDAKDTMVRGGWEAVVEPINGGERS